MKLFPTNTYTFKLFGEETEALDRLKRRTEFSESLSSQCTDKSFRGIIDRNSFRIISSEIGKGALCVLTGKIENKTAHINLAYVTLDTPIHEILGHPIIRAIKNKQQEDGKSITKEEFERETKTYWILFN